MITEDLKGHSLRTQPSTIKRVNESAKTQGVKQYEWIEAALNHFDPDNNPDHRKYLASFVNPSESDILARKIQGLPKAEREKILAELRGDG